MTLLTTWLSLYPNKVAALAALNGATGSETKHSRLAEWQDGRRAVPRKVERFMVQDLRAARYKGAFCPTCGGPIKTVKECKP